MEYHTNILRYLIESLITNAHFYVAIILGYKIAKEYIETKKEKLNKLDEIIQNQKFTQKMLDYTNKHLPK